MKTSLNTPILIFCILMMSLSGLSNFQASAQQKDLNPVEIIKTNETVTAFAETDRFYWIGTENGLYQVKKKNNKVCHLTEKNSKLPSNLVTAICAKSNGEVFIGTNKGILCYAGFVFLLVNTENAAMTSDDITALHCDKDDLIWIGTSSKSISMIRYINMKNFNIFSIPDAVGHLVTFEEKNPKEMTLVLAGGDRLKFANGRLEKTTGGETAEFSGR